MHVNKIFSLKFLIFSLLTGLHTLSVWLYMICNYNDKHSDYDDEDDDMAMMMTMMRRRRRRMEDNDGMGR